MEREDSSGKHDYSYSTRPSRGVSSSPSCGRKLALLAGACKFYMYMNKRRLDIRKTLRCNHST
jgi:hypothetical protein